MKADRIDSDALWRIVGEFETKGEPAGFVPHGSGHINDTYCVTLREGGAERKYVFQKINDRIFRDVDGLMGNVQRVTAHLLRKLRDAKADDADRGTLRLIRTKSGGAYARVDGGECWRAYHFIPGASTYDVCTGPEQAYEAAKAFGRFQSMLVDLPGKRLVETLAYFHHTPRRFAALEKAIEGNQAGRRERVAEEIGFCTARKDITGSVVDLMGRGKLPERITHNDTKLNNVMMDDRTGKGICVVDLDTVMPGTVLYDFGDMVRTFIPTALEDEPDLSKVDLDMELFGALVRGYAESAGGFLTPAERSHLVFAGKLITFTIGIRFLTDYLAGDAYFKISRPDHNLDRARTQFKMVGLIEQREKEMEEIVRGELG